MEERERQRHGQRQKETEQGDENPCIDPGEAVILPGGGMLCLAGLPVCASSAGSHWVFSAFNLTLTWLCTSQAASLPLSSDLNPVVYLHAISILSLLLCFPFLNYFYLIPSCFVSTFVCHPCSTTMLCICYAASVSISFLDIFMLFISDAEACL